MKGLYVVVLVLCLQGAVLGLGSLFDDQACVFTPAVPTPRVVNATAPVLIDSPGFNASDVAGSEYPPSVLCEWVVYLQNEFEDTLDLNFIEFDLVSATDCVNDYVEIYEGIDDTGPLLGRHCGNIVPDFSTTSKTLFIRFESNNDTLVNTGFLARLGYTIVNTACEPNGQEFNQPQGFFYSLNYPQNYANNLACTYKFNIPDGQRIRVEMGSFDLAQNCNDDVLEFRAGDPMFVEETLAARFYGDESLPAITYSPGTDFQIEFSSDNTGTASGYWGYYEFVPQ